MILSGSLCALATPLRASDDALDADALARLVEQQIGGGTRALVVAGSTGEAAALDDGEFSQLLERAFAHARGRVPLLAGTGLAGTRNTVLRTRRARDAGIDVALVVAPPYVRPTQEGLYRHFSEIADHGGLPVMLYNVPSRTACDLQPETVARLASHGNIMGIKEAVADESRMRDLLALQSAAFAVFSGDDATAARAQLSGAAGVISVAANVVPRRFADLCDACAAGDEARALALDHQLQPLYAFLGAEPNPIPVKWCLAQIGICEDHLRLPLLPLGAALRTGGADVLARLGLVEAEPAVG